MLTRSLSVLSLVHLQRNQFKVQSERSCEARNGRCYINKNLHDPFQNLLPSTPAFVRMYFSFLSTLILKTVFTSGVTVGPRGTLTLSNVDISPDGHLRTSGKQFFLSSPCWYHFSRASLVNGVHPGPVITMSKVIPAWLLVCFLILVETRISGWVAWDECRKSIVKWGHDCWDVYCKCNPPFFQGSRRFLSVVHSTGMEYFNIAPVLWMARRVSPSVPLRPETHLCISSAPSKLERSGTILISVSFFLVSPFLAGLYLRRAILWRHSWRVGCLWSRRP